MFIYIFVFILNIHVEIFHLNNGKRFIRGDKCRE